MTKLRTLRRRRRVIFNILLAVGTVTYGSEVYSNDLTPRHVQLAERVMPHCVEEDGSGGPQPCVWEGTVDGNGVGSSYVVWVNP